MRYYETVVIIHPALEGGHLKDDIVEIQKLIERKSVSIKNTEVWGRRKLAYLIDKQKYGTYIFIQFIGESVRINEMNVELEHNPNVLAYQTIKISETSLREQTADLETQIAGQSKIADTEKREKEKPEDVKAKVPEESEEEIIPEDAKSDTIPSVENNQPESVDS